MKITSIVLQLNLTGDMEPGWYLYGVVDEQPQWRPVLLPPEAVSRLAGAFLPALEASDEEIPAVTPSQLVESGNALIEQALKEQLRQAEEQAARIANLRRRLAALQTQGTPMIPQDPRPKG